MVRLLADAHIALRTIQFLRDLGHDVERVANVLASSATDRETIAAALRLDRVILTQDLDFSALIALSGKGSPSAVSLRLSSSRVEEVNRALASALPALTGEIAAGVLVTIEDARVRVRRIPIE